MDDFLWRALLGGVGVAILCAPVAAAGAGLVPYQHHHDHVHGAHGDIQPLPAADAHG